MVSCGYFFLFSVYSFTLSLFFFACVCNTQCYLGLVSFMGRALFPAFFLPECCPVTSIEEFSRKSNIGINIYCFGSWLFSEQFMSHLRCLVC